MNFIKRIKNRGVSPDNVRNTGAWTYDIYLPHTYRNDALMR